MEAYCRVCLSTHSLSSWSKIAAQEFRYSDLFYRITALRKPPNQIEGWLCDDCSSQILEIYDFIERAIETEKFFSEIRSPHEADTNESFSVEITPFSEQEIEIFKSRQRKKKLNSEETEWDLGPTLHELTKNQLETNLLDFKTSEDDDFQDDMIDNNDIEEEDDDVMDEFHDSEAENISENVGKCNKSAKIKKKPNSKRQLQKNKLLCEACPRTFATTATLQQHLNTHDENRKREYACELCDLKFLTSNALKAHQDTHNEKRVKPFPCDQCDKAFFQKGTLNIHRRIHTGNLVECKICRKRYPRLVDLNNHMRSHTGEEPFKCSTCGKKFKYGSTLYTHVRKVHLGFIHKCCYCSKQYQDKESLIEHKQQLHQNKTYTCVICDKVRAKKYAIKCHIRSIHGFENSEDLEDLIISSETARQHRTKRNFTNIEYEKHIQRSKTATAFRTQPSDETKKKKGKS